MTRPLRATTLDQVPDTDPRPRWETGDRVRLREDLGGFFRPRVRRGTDGIVVALAEDRSVWVRFDGDKYTELVPPDQLDRASTAG